MHTVPRMSPLQWLTARLILFWVDLGMRMSNTFYGQYLYKHREKKINFFKSLIVGHRGCRGQKLPENTLSAFKFAADSSATAIELDVRLSKDGKLVVMHDHRIDRVMKGSGFVNNMNIEELKKYRYKEGAGDDSVMELQEALDFCVSRNLKLFIEAKDLTFNTNEFAQALADLYQKNGKAAYSVASVISFNPFLLYKLRSLDPKIVSCYLCADVCYMHALRTKCEFVPAWVTPGPARVIDFVLMELSHSNRFLDFIGVSFVGPEYHQITSDYVAHHKSNARGVYTWTMNDSTKIGQMISWEVSYASDYLFPSNQEYLEACRSPAPPECRSM